MEKSIVYISMRDDNNIDCSYSIVQKDELKVIIVLKDLECAIFDYNNLKNEKKFKYLFLKQYYDNESAYKDFFKLIGKMCKKQNRVNIFQIIELKIIEWYMIILRMSIWLVLRKKIYNDRYIIFKKFVIDNIDNF